VEGHDDSSLVLTTLLAVHLRGGGQKLLLENLCLKGVQESSKPPILINAIVREYILT
jgi:hypothetical protein